MTARLRMFAGPNGSGKSTLNQMLPSRLLGVYLNADDVERQIRENGILRLADYEIRAEREEVTTFFEESELLKQKEATGGIEFRDGCLDFRAIEIDSYVASVVVAFLRSRLMASRQSFTIETVMSHPSKVELLQEAQRLGFRTYVYFVATVDPEINVSRVGIRVRNGGHDVPVEKIKSRYYRSIDLLSEAIEASNRAYIFDNSSDGEKTLFFAEVTEGKHVKLHSDLIPAWFEKNVIRKNHSHSPE